MVQVDIFWSYGIGAGLAVAAHRQIAAESGATDSIWKAAFASPFFSKMLLFMGLVFVPSGMWLLWQFSSWETMHVGDRHLPVWLVGLFCSTNVSQGALGFALSHALIRRGRLYAAWLHMIAAYFGFFFILIHGWNGTGYQRFFSPTREHFENWSWSTAAEWLHSDIALTLYGMGAVLLPLLGGMTLSWIQKGARASQLNPHPLPVLAGFLGSVLILSLGLAAFASILLIQLGLIAGIILSFLGLLIVTHPRLGLAARFFRAMTFTAKSNKTWTLPRPARALTQ